ncbi:MAG: acetyl-CoA acetyltransferase [Myxococcota bacterium]|nr:acetyl-CoA acetyltransferase [Myxococcota bacterium]
MTLDPQTPVLVGVGTVQQRAEDPSAAQEPLDLMERALRRAGEDAGDPGLLARAGEILVPQGFWDYADPARALATRLDATGARSTLVQLGMLQTTLFGQAAQAIAEGRADIVLVAGGEAKYRSLRAQVEGVSAANSEQHTTPDTVLSPTAEIIHPFEIGHGLQMPVGQFSVIESALRFADGEDLDDHAEHIAQLWSRMSEVAAGNPEAWRPERVPAADIRSTANGNRMLAFPYTKSHNSQWNVDQAAGLVFTSVATARAAGIPEARWIFPWTVVESSFMQPLAQRRELHRSMGFAAAGRRTYERIGRAADEIDHFELYSCFPSAVRVQCRELGIDDKRALTVTGGMAFAGGPLNNFVLQAQAKMAQVLRDAPGSVGMVNAVSGILNKQGVSIWSSEAPPRAFGYEDVSAEVARDAGAAQLVEQATGAGRVSGYTVLFEGEEPAKAVLFCELEDGSRVLASSPALARQGTREELCGRSVMLSDDGNVDLA